MIIWNFNSIKAFLSSCVWNVCEYFHVDLGKYAPIVFGWVVERKGKKK